MWKTEVVFLILSNININYTNKAYILEQKSVRPSDKNVFLTQIFNNYKKWQGRPLIFVIFQKCVLIFIHAVNCPFLKDLCCVAKLERHL